MTTVVNSTNETVRQLFGMACPACGSDESLSVCITAWAELSTDGTDASGEHDWHSRSFCMCRSCHKTGYVKDFRIKDGGSTNA
jgi:hypothetical protein